MVFVRGWPPAVAARSWRAVDKKAAPVSRPDGSTVGADLRANPAGFPPQARLHTATEFGRVFADPARSNDRYFTVLARPNERSIARLGLTISRRAAKRAVDRNRLKRLARESFRMHQPLPPWDFVILARTGADRADRRALRDSLDKHFERLAKLALTGRNG